MFKIKNTGKAIGISAVIVCVCFAMLLGTTFAWFTDNATTKVNTIQTGSFDINILEVDAIGTITNNTLVGKTLDFVYYDGSNGQHTYEGNILWEPGMTILSEKFAIKNEGNYALKFNINDVFANAVKGQNDRGVGNLKNVLSYKVYILYNNNWVEYLTYTQGAADAVYGNLGADISLYPANNAQSYPSSYQFYIEITMDQNSGNEYQECSLTGLAVNVNAAQLGYENDSFGTGYDAGRDYEPNATPAPSADELINP